ncbi:cytochrome c peroxidase [Mariniflexile soesokkakense]|uniref:Cytochrome c peroxidase n=1 Tax=Mariniflexile soesokkakense TaxID=1343160 RepID=A0ABV0ADB9_9FLAO
MKPYHFLLLLFCLFLLFGNTNKPTYIKQNTAVKKIITLYGIQFLEFQNEVIILDSLANKAENIEDIIVIKEQFIKTRIAYKKIEFLFNFYLPSFDNTFINGAPIPKISDKYEAGKIIEPNGLQALDALIFDPDAIQNIEHIKKLSVLLKEKVDLIAKTHLPLSLKSGQIIDALRSGVVRIFTLGLTGFDTPASENTIAETLGSFKSLKESFSLFNENLNPFAKKTFNKVIKLFEKAEKTLKKNDDFDTFDRISFLKTVINPLYATLLEFQELNELYADPFIIHAQNYTANNLFDNNFLNTELYSEFVYLPLNNPSSIKLGKVLYEDPQLSKNSIMSCATCHDSNKGFADGLPKSKTNKSNVFSSRNSPTILNVGYANRYFWDMRAYDLEKQVAHVIDNDLEFNTSFDEIIKKLNANPEYVKQFKDVYGGISKHDINSRSISNAIAAYVNSLKSLNSEFDKYIRNEIKTYPEAAKRGFNLFMGKAACGTCHFAPVFNGTIPPFYLETESEVLGITQGFDSINPVKDLDPGRIDNGLLAENQQYYQNSFKTVSIRNIALTAPYMHNGMFNTLEDVLDFYNHGGGAGLGLDIENQTLSDTPLNLTKKEKADIIIFMKTLTDTTGLTKKFSKTAY